MIVDEGLTLRVTKPMRIGEVKATDVGDLVTSKRASGSSDGPTERQSKRCPDRSARSHFSSRIIVVRVDRSFLFIEQGYYVYVS